MKHTLNRLTSIVRFSVQSWKASLTASVIILIFLCSCSYKQYVAVDSFDGIPKGSKEILVKTSIDRAKDAMKQAGILFSCNESGCQTEEILLDEGTRAKYSLIEMDSVVKVIPYWGITDRVRSDMAWSISYQAAAVATNEMKRVDYHASASRPKKVFDYAVQLFLPVGRLKFQ